MTSARRLDIPTRLGLTMLTLIAAEYLVASPLVSIVLKASSSIPMALGLVLLFLPRFFLSIGVALAFRPFGSALTLLAAIIVYAAFLLWRFDTVEIYVAWDQLPAIARAIIPYLAGLFGLLIAYFSPRSHPTVTPPEQRTA